MRLPRVRFTVRRMMIAVAASASVLALSSCTETVYFSCRGCENQKEVRTRLIFILPVERTEAITTSYPSQANHLHTWSPYTQSGSLFLTGPTEYFW